ASIEKDMLAAVLEQSGVSPILFHAGGFAERFIKDCDAILRRTGGCPQGREEHKTDDEPGTSYRLHLLLLSLSRHTGRASREQDQRQRLAKSSSTSTKGPIASLCSLERMVR